MLFNAGRAPPTHHPIIPPGALTSNKQEAGRELPHLSVGSRTTTTILTSGSASLSRYGASGDARYPGLSAVVTSCKRGTQKRRSDPINAHRKREHVKKGRGRRRGERENETMGIARLVVIIIIITIVHIRRKHHQANIATPSIAVYFVLLTRSILEVRFCSFAHSVITQKNNNSARQMQYK